jgi:hypothetical protein
VAGDLGGEAAVQTIVGGQHPAADMGEGAVDIGDADAKVGR